MLPVPLRRDRFTTEVGPDDSGSKPGIEACNHLPEISGMDAPLSLPLTDPIVGATDWPKTGVATTAASNTREKFRHCKSMLSSLFRCVPLEVLAQDYTNWPRRRRGAMSAPAGRPP